METAQVTTSSAASGQAVSPEVALARYWAAKEALLEKEPGDEGSEWLLHDLTVQRKLLGASGEC